MQDRSLELTLLPFDEPGNDPVSIASRLWSVLDVAHKDLNALARTNAQLQLSAAQIELTNGLLQQIIRLLGASDYAENLRLLSKTSAVSVSEALMLLGHYKGALRYFRVDVLGENTYKF